MGWMPVRARKGLARAITSLSPRSLQRILGALQRLPNGEFEQRMAADKLHKMAGVLDAGSLQEIYLRLASHWFEPDELVLGACEPKTFLSSQTAGEFGDFAETMMYGDTITFLPDDILTKVDRASMAVSLEVRAPYLDHDVIAFAWSLPLKMKIHHGKGKRILRKLLHKFVPPEIVERPKMGFGIPLDSWLRGPLREWAEDLLSEERLRREGILAPQMVREKWEEHLADRHNWQYHLWDVLMFQSWLEHARASSETSCAAEARA
jgi:asparagine synthase (glutamine-hydrolysing)